MYRQAIPAHCLVALTLLKSVGSMFHFFTHAKYEIMNSRQLYPRLMRYIAPYWEALVFALTGMAVMAATAPMLAALMEWMVDGAFVNKDMEVMQLVLLGIIVLFIARGAAGYISTYAISWVGSKLVVDLRG